MGRMELLSPRRSASGKQGAVSRGGITALQSLRATEESLALPTHHLPFSPASSSFLESVFLSSPTISAAGLVSPDLRQHLQQIATLVFA